MTLVMPLSDEDSDGDEESRESNRQNILQKMLGLDRELILLAVLLTAYAAVRNMNQTISKNPLPKPFFLENPWVQDFYHGEIHEAFSLANQADVAFVMFYAPWDADCQRAKPIFEKVARYYHQQIYFMAVNCWEPSSVCKAHFNKIKQYPVFVAYFLRNRGVEYQGIIDFAHMTHFLSSILLPLDRVHDSQTLKELHNTHDAVILACIPFYGMFGGEHYYSFYKSSLKYLELDPRRDVAFAVMTNEKACHRTGFFSANMETSYPSMKLYTWNATKVFDGAWDQTTIVKWVHDNMQKITSWVYPPGIKSNLLSQFINRGPTLILFTPRNMFLSHSPDYNLLKLVALDYFDCTDYNVNGAFDWSLFSPSLFVSSAEQWETINNLKQLCSSTVLSEFKQHLQFFKTSKKSSNFLYQSYTECNASVNNQTYGSCTQNYFKDHLAKNSEAFLQTKMLNFYYPVNDDVYSSESLFRYRLKSECRKLRFALKYLPDNWLSKNLNHNTQKRKKFSAKSLACKSNSTLSFLAMDSLHFDHFASNLGINISKKYDKKTAFIIDSKAESIYYLNSTFISMDLLENFIYNFSQNDLKRFLRSSDGKLTHKNVNHSSVESISSNMFYNAVINNNRTVLVFYYSPFCAYSQAIFHVYLSVANALKLLSSFISFVRIDGESNDLEWPFTVDKYPSIMLFPSTDKSNSKLFDSKTKITILNLSQFILYNLNFELRAQAQILFCLKQSFSDFNSIDNCIINLKLSFIYYLNHYNNLLRNTLIHFKLQTNESKNVISSKKSSIRSTNLNQDGSNHVEVNSNFIWSTSKIRCKLLYFQLVNNYVNNINFSNLNVNNISKAIVNFYHIYLNEFNSTSKFNSIACSKLFDSLKHLQHNLNVENDSIKSIQRNKLHSKNILSVIMCQQKNSTKCKNYSLRNTNKNDKSLYPEQFHSDMEHFSADSKTSEETSNSFDDLSDHNIEVPSENFNRNQNKYDLEVHASDVNNNEYSLSDEL